MFRKWQSAWRLSPARSSSRLTLFLTTTSTLRDSMSLYEGTSGRHPRSRSVSYSAPEDMFPFRSSSRSRSQSRSRSHSRSRSRSCSIPTLFQKTSHMPDSSDYMDTDPLALTDTRYSLTQPDLQSRSRTHTHTSSSYRSIPHRQVARSGHDAPHEDHRFSIPHDRTSKVSLQTAGRRFAGMESSMALDPFSYPSDHSMVRN